MKLTPRAQRENNGGHAYMSPVVMCQTTPGHKSPLDQHPDFLRRINRYKDMEPVKPQKDRDLQSNGTRKQLYYLIPGQVVYYLPGPEEAENRKAILHQIY